MRYHESGNFRYVAIICGYLEVLEPQKIENVKISLCTTTYVAGIVNRKNWKRHKFQTQK